MRQPVSVRIVGFEVVGDNAVELIYQFKGTSKRIQKVMSLDEARKKGNRVGQYIQVFVDDMEYERIYGHPPNRPVYYGGIMRTPVPKPSVVADTVADDEEEKPEVVVEYDEAEKQIGLFDN